MKTNNTQETKILNLHFKWTVSRGRDTYGYNICTLYVDGVKKASCNGGGYDMQGAALGDWMAKEFQDNLSMLFNNDVNTLLTDDKLDYFSPTSFYGVRIVKDNGGYHIYLDGGCGFNAMERIANAIGIRLQWNKDSDRYKNDSWYTAIISPQV